MAKIHVILLEGIGDKSNGTDNPHTGLPDLADEATSVWDGDDPASRRLLRWTGEDHVEATLFSIVFSAHSPGRVFDFPFPAQGPEQKNLFSSDFYGDSQPAPIFPRACPAIF